MKDFVCIAKSDVAKTADIIRDMMSRYRVRDYRNSSYCEFCRQEEDENRNIHHKIDCTGLVMLDTFHAAANPPAMNVEQLGELVQQPEINPIDGVAALKWLVTAGAHDMATREILRVVRKIKQKMGIPI